MLEHLFIRPEDHAARRWRWHVLDPAGEGVSGSGSLSEAAPLAVGRCLVLLVPGEAVLLTTVSLPVRSRAKAMAAVPWSLEDRLLTDVESLHFALGRPDAQGNWPVAVIDHRILTGWLEACRECGLTPHAAVPEPLALAPPETSCWTVLEEPDRIVCRTGHTTGFVCTPALLPEIAGMYELPTTVDRVTSPGADIVWPERFMSALQPARSIPDPLHAFGCPTDTPSLDLLQGLYNLHERTGRTWRRWRAPAALSAVLAILLLVDQGLAHRELIRREEALREAAEEVLRQAVPDIERVVNPRVQLRNRLEAVRASEAGADRDMLPVLSRAGPILGGMDGIELVGLDWRNGTLDVIVEADELAAFERLQHGLRARDFEAELRGVEQGEEQVRGQIRVIEERE